MSVNALPRLLPYASLLESRPLEDIDMLVVHCTELPDLEIAREYGERVIYPKTGTGNSGHYYIDRDGTTEVWVPSIRVAHHVRGYNHRSVGIELVNAGRYPNWFHSHYQAMTDTYPTSQIESLLNLITALSEHLPSLSLIAGHQDLDTDTVPASDDPALSVQRKRDPGEQFPWPEILNACDLERFQPDGPAAN
jgi:N-acetylmuramoyl-L-alanine amidase